MDGITFTAVMAAITDFITDFAVVIGITAAVGAVAYGAKRLMKVGK